MSLLDPIAGADTRGGREAMVAETSSVRDDSVAETRGHRDDVVAATRLDREDAVAERRDDAVVVGAPGPDGIVGDSAAIAALRDAIARVAATPRTTVLIHGESGSGKELVARAIHARSARARRPFVAVNCAALTESLLEAELFGYEPGAFTGGLAKGRDGLFAAAEGGSLLLDEIGELEIELQAKLLRVLQERSYRRIGAHVDRPADVRILASTNRDLRERVAEGSFREDLYYRLNVMSIRVPPLRERMGDVPHLARVFLERCAVEFEREYAGFSREALARLCAHAWPGNVRELANAVERAALMTAGGEIPVHAIELDPPSAARGTRAFDRDPSAADACAPVTDHGTDRGAGHAAGDRSIKTMERALIERVLAESDGNRSRAARALGVNRTTLYNKLKSYGLCA